MNPHGYLSMCQCEHISHFENAQATPLGNPGHSYGRRFHPVVPVKTPWGTFEVCTDCSKDCHHG